MQLATEAFARAMDLRGSADGIINYGREARNAGLTTVVDLASGPLLPDQNDLWTSVVDDPAYPARVMRAASLMGDPSGDAVVYTVGWPDAETDTNRAVLEACDLDGGQRRRLTDGHADRQPRFSPDGRRLAFLRSRPGEATRVAVAEWPSCIRGGDDVGARRGAALGAGGQRNHGHDRAQQERRGPPHPCAPSTSLMPTGAATSSWS